MSIVLVLCRGYEEILFYVESAFLSHLPSEIREVYLKKAEEMVEDLVYPLVELEGEDLKYAFRETMRPFWERAQKLTEEILQRYRDEDSLEQFIQDEKRLVDLLYDSAGTWTSRIGREPVADVRHALSLTYEYDATLFRAMLEQPNRLNEVLEHFDIEDLTSNLAGLALSLTSVYVLMAPLAGEPDPATAKDLARWAEEYATDLSAYADTLQIELNPERVERIRKAEGDIRFGRTKRFSEFVRERT